MSSFAGVLRSHGVVRGDRVLIYMPMIPEAIVAMLACARIGAIHIVVFGGFAAKELSVRISHSQVERATCYTGGVEHSGEPRSQIWGLPEWTPWKISNV